MKASLPKLTHLAPLMVSFSLLFLSGCNREPQREKTELLPEAAKDERHFSPYQPANPYKEAAQGVLARAVFEADGPPGLRVEVRDWLVAGGQTSESMLLPGAAVLEVRSGSGLVTVGERRQEIASGKTVSFSEGERVVISNPNALPLTIRAYLFLAR